MHDLPPGVGAKTPARIKRVQGLLTLSSSKKILSARGRRSRNINIDFDYGLVKRDLFAKFAINVFQYILYDNEVLPVPFQYFQRFFAKDSERNWNNKQCLIVKHRKVLEEIFSILDVMFDFVDELIANSSIDLHSVGICFGDSIRFAKDIYVLNMSELNLCSRVVKYRMPHLTLSYLINTFYKKLLNEVNAEPARASSRKNVKNIIFLAKVNSKHADSLGQLVEEYSSRGDVCSKIPLGSKFRFVSRNHQQYNLGCALSRTTTFNFLHPSIEDLQIPNVDFEIFSENNIDEVIEECLDEYQMKTLDHDTASEDSDVEANSLEQPLEVDTEQVDSHQSNEYSWIQIGENVPCLCQLK